MCGRKFDLWNSLQEHVDKDHSNGFDHDDLDVSIDEEMLGKFERQINANENS